MQAGKSVVRGDFLRTDKRIVWTMNPTKEEAREKEVAAADIELVVHTNPSAAPDNVKSSPAATIPGTPVLERSPSTSAILESMSVGRVNKYDRKTKSSRELRVSRVKKTLNIRYCTHVGLEGTLLIVFKLAVGAGHGWLLYEYTSHFRSFTRAGVYIFMFFGIFALVAAAQSILSWEGIALDYSARALEIRTKQKVVGLKAFYAKTFINGPYFLWKLYFTEVLESINQIRNVFEIYLCSLPVQISSAFVWALVLDAFFRAYYMSQKNTPRRRDIQINVDIVMDFSSAVVPICTLWFGYDIVIWLEDMLWLISLPSFFLLLKARSMFREIIRLRSVKELRLRISARNEPQKNALAQQKSIPPKVRYGLIVYFVGYGLFMFVLGLFHPIVSSTFGKGCDASAFGKGLELWRDGCEVKVPFCKDVFHPACDCAVLQVQSHNWTVLPDAIKDMQALTYMAINHGPLADLGDIEMLSNLRRVDLSFNLLETIPGSFGGLELVKVIVNNNRLTGLPPEVWGHRYIVWLQVDNNNIGNIPEDSTIEKAISLRSLGISNNSISMWPSGISGLFINSLSLAGNQLALIPPEVGKLTSTSYLMLNNNAIHSISKNIGLLTELKVLDVRNNSLSSLEGFDGLRRLDELYLEGNPVCSTFLKSESAIVQQLVLSNDEAGRGCKRQCSPYCQDVQLDLGKCFAECNIAVCKFSGGNC